MSAEEIPPFWTVLEWTAAVERAPDGSLVRPLARLAGLGSVATFELPAGAVSAAVQHRTVAEIWYVLSGTGELWRRQADRGEITPLRPGVCATLPAGVAFQFRADLRPPEAPLSASAGHPPSLAPGRPGAPSRAQAAARPDLHGVVAATAVAPAQPLRVLGLTMPPWPGADEARPATGPWSPSSPSSVALG